MMENDRKLYLELSKAEQDLSLDNFKILKQEAKKSLSINKSIRTNMTLK
jgi:hypothetical protein